MPKRKDEIQDIYQSQSPDFEQDFTPQVAKEVIETRQRDLRRTRLISTFLGGLIIVLAVVLTSVVIRNTLRERKATKRVLIEEKSYIPQYSLPADALWVMDYKPVADRADPDEEPGKKPVSAKWVKKTAYHIIMGQQAIAIGKPDQALDHFEVVYQIYPEIEGLHQTMGTIYLQNDHFEQAVEHLELALSEKESFMVLNNLGSAYIGTEEYDQAEKHLLRARELRPEYPGCSKNLAVLYRKMERADDAVLYFEKYLDLQPGDLDTMQTYALYLTKLGRWEKASTFINSLVAEVPDIAPIYFLLGQIEIQNGRPDKAIAAIQRGIQLVEPNLALAWMDRDEFNTLRESREFRNLVDQLEIASVSLQDLDSNSVKP